jgi:hypothetical protein
MKRLTQIGQKAGTDKATHHYFTEVYDDVFQQYTSPRILEIGVEGFASIQMYIDYFTNPYIVAMDIHQKDLYITTPTPALQNFLASPNWKFIIGDQSKVEDVQRCIESEKFDIILDDGGHTMKQQQVTFGVLLDQVKPGGYYILEDLHTSFAPHYREADCEYTSYEMLLKVRHRQLPFSNYISLSRQQQILDLIESVDIYARDSNNIQNSQNSITSIIKIKDESNI